MRFVRRTRRGFNPDTGTSQTTEEYEVDGKRVSAEEYERRFEENRPKVKGGDARKMASKRAGWKKPIKSLGLAVLKKNIKKAAARDRKNGVPTEYTPDGCPVIRSTAHQRALMKTLGVHNNGSYY